MERRNLILFSLFITLAMTIACKESPSSVKQTQNPNTPSTAVKAEPGAPTPAPNAPPQIEGVGPTPATDTPPPNLLGPYILSEVEHNGQVTMIRPENSTVFTFFANGAYTRESKIGGKVTHTDTGRFSVEKKDQLVLKIEMSDNKIQVPPVEKTHTVVLSSDGEELTMKSKEGKAALFRRKSATGK